MFNIEWRATYWDPSCAGVPLNFEVRLYESQTRLDIIYGTLNGNGGAATVGIQKDTGGVFSQFECNSGVLNSGLMLTYQFFACTNGGGQCPPVASFIATPTSGTAPLPVNFTDTSTGAITNRFWDFGDGSSTNTLLTSFAHIYNSAGTNTVALVVAGPGGFSTNVRTNYITAVLFTAYQSWQMQYFGCTDCLQAAATTDPDGDGLSNMQEFLAGTDPTNSASAFRIISIAREADDALITWSTAGGHTNVVQAAPDLSGSYSIVSPNIVILGGGDTMTNYLDVGGMTNTPTRYYRIRLIP